MTASAPNNTALPRRPRGRPSRHGQSYADTRALLIRRGTELLSQRGVSATSLDEVLKSVGVPKGSFYHYFPSKDAFVLATLDAYADYLSRKLDRHFTNPALTPLARLQAFVDDACQGVERYDFSRGCLVGNLGQEAGCLDEAIQKGWKTSSCAGRGNWLPACSSLPTTGLSAATRIVPRLPTPSGSAGKAPSCAPG
jgi:AcrR family transcriptional regulator